MSLIIEQRFPLGRFHATRWRQNPFEDLFGEFPPSPYRLLRALTARWFQYARETGDSDTKKRDALLRRIASELPSFALPEFTWRGQPLKQYIPYKVEWTAKGAADPAYKKAQTTLAEDHYRLIPPDAVLFWHWENLEIEDEQKDLLDELLKRVLYFGRAESFSLLRRAEILPSHRKLNCTLAEKSTTDAVPVLAHIPDQELNLAALLDFTDGKELRGRAVPPETAWFYAVLPPKPVAKPKINRNRRFPSDLQFLQFAVGGVVYPPMNQWVKVTERFRGSVIKNLCQQLSKNQDASYRTLTTEQRESISLITGKHDDGKPLQGHKHTYFFLYPDEQGFPTRLIAWRNEPFTEIEINSMLAAAEKPVRWDYDLNDWAVRLVPLPFHAKPPNSLFAPSKTWISATPFVLPAQRHRFRKSGCERTTESPKLLLAKLLDKSGAPAPSKVEQLGKEPVWMQLHETLERRIIRKQSRIPWKRMGFWMRVEFLEPVIGPMLLGDSCHFGLGLFKSVEQ